MFVGLLLFITLLFNPQPSNAQEVPLFYQLLQAYAPKTYHTTLPTNTDIKPVPTPTPLQNIGQVLGVNTSPVNVGGEGKIITIALLGDSMIDTLGKDLPSLYHALSQYFPNHKFNLLNYGVGGRDIEYGLFRLTNDYEYLGQNIPNLISQKPDIVIVESFAYNNFGNTQAGIDRHWLALGAITSTLRQQLPQTKIVLAATIAPNSVVFGNGIKDLHFTAMEKIEKSSTIKIYLQNLINFATSQGFPLADAYRPSLFNNEGLREFINPDDNLHPSTSGATFFSDTVADSLFKNKIIE